MFYSLKAQPEVAIMFRRLSSIIVADYFASLFIPCHGAWKSYCCFL